MRDVRDALISQKATSLTALPAGAVLGTASLRRAAQVKRLRPDMNVTLLRGNVETRLRKAESGEVDATLLAIRDQERAGLDIITDGEVRRDDAAHARRVRGQSRRGARDEPLGPRAAWGALRPMAFAPDERPGGVANHHDIARRIHGDGARVVPC